MSNVRYHLFGSISGFDFQFLCFRPFFLGFLFALIFSTCAIVPIYLSGISLIVLSTFICVFLIILIVIFGHIGWNWSYVNLLSIDICFFLHIFFSDILLYSGYRIYFFLYFFWDHSIERYLDFQVTKVNDLFYNVSVDCYFTYNGVSGHEYVHAIYLVFEVLN